MLYTLSLHSSVCQLYHNKTGRGGGGSKTNPKQTQENTKSSNQKYWEKKIHRRVSMKSGADFLKR